MLPTPSSRGGALRRGVRSSSERDARRASDRAPRQASRTHRTPRAAVAAASVLAALVASGCAPAASPTAMPSPVESPTTVTPAPSMPAASPTPTRAPETTRTPTRTPTPTPTRTPTPTPTQTPTPTPARPANTGTLPAGLALPHAAADGYETLPALPEFARCDDPISPEGVTASRFLFAEGPESVQTEGVLVFADAASAERFVGRVSDATRACPVATNATDAEHRYANAAQETRTEQGVGLRVDSTLETNASGTWGARPGGTAYLLVRKGAVVAYAEDSSEAIVGSSDPSTTEAVTALRTVVDQILATAR